MKEFKRKMKYLFVWLVPFVVMSCDGMDAYYKEFIEDGPIIYIGKVDSLQSYAGRNRVKLQWKELLDPRAKRAKVFWGNRTDSIEFRMEQAADNQFFIDGLQEGSYVFQFYTYDEIGNSSIVSETPCNVYGDVFEGLLTNIRITSSKLKDGILTLTLPKVEDETYVGIEITYITSRGEEKIVMKEVDGTTISIENFDSNKFVYRSVYLPEDTAIDYFYSTSDEYEL